MKQLKRVHLKSMIVGLVFGAMSVVIMNAYVPSPIQNAYASDCPQLWEIKELLSNCINMGDGNHFLC